MNSLKKRLYRNCPSVATEEFFGFLYNDCQLHIELCDGRIDDALKSNPKIVDLIIKRDPIQAFYAPENLLKLEHIKIVENYLNGKNKHIEVPSIPSIFSKSKIIIENCIEKSEKRV